MPEQTRTTQAPAGGSLADRLVALADERLAQADADLAARFPGDRPDRQPVHTVYVPGDVYTADVTRQWGERALELAGEFLATPDAVAQVTGMDPALAEQVLPRVLAKLAAEPVEDLRVDFEDGYGRRADAEEDDAVARAATAFGGYAAGGSHADGAPPWHGIRFKCFEEPTRARGVRTLIGLVSGLAEAGPLPAGLRLTLPKVTSVDQVSTMVELCGELERELGLAEPLGFEIQVETPQAIQGPGGVATIAPMVHAAAGRCTGLHYGTYDYSAGLGIAAAHQTLEHPAADHAKSVMQLAAAQTGVWCSDGSTNVVAYGSAAEAAETFALHHRLVTRALERGYYQGWDMHPGHLVTRYLATYAFFRGALPAAARRLRAYVDQSGGDVMDEPATARMLSRAVLRGLHCGALDDAEVDSAAGLSQAELLALAR